MNADYEIRRGTPADSYAVFLLFEETLYDLQVRMGHKPEVRFDDPAKLARIWDLRKRLYDHQLIRADEFWVAEKEGTIIGLARSVPHEGVRELTELFVKPRMQDSGVGKQLFERAFKKESGVGRALVATLDIPAQVRYIKAGLQHRFMVMHLGKRPETQILKGKLVTEELTDTSENREMLNRIDRNLLGFTHPNVHDYLFADRTGYKYSRPNGDLLGYGYVGVESGPFALVDPGAYPDVLAHAENEAARRGLENFGFEVPSINLQAMNHLLSRKYRMDSFIGVLMSDFTLPAAENYILPSPPFSL